MTQEACLTLPVTTTRLLRRLWSPLVVRGLESRQSFLKEIRRSGGLGLVVFIPSRLYKYLRLGVTLYPHDPHQRLGVVVNRSRSKRSPVESVESVQYIGESRRSQRDTHFISTIVMTESSKVLRIYSMTDTTSRTVQYPWITYIC